MNLNLALIERWLTGRSLARGLPLPIKNSGGLCVEVGSAEELRRHVFLDAGPALQACAAQTRVPLVFLKAAVAPDVMRAALPGSWRSRFALWPIVHARTAERLFRKAFPWWLRLRVVMS